LRIIPIRVPHDDPVLVDLVVGADHGGAEADQMLHGGVDLRVAVVVGDLRPAADAHVEVNPVLGGLGLGHRARPMVVRFQVSFDAADPQRLAAFWQQALGYQQQPPPEGYASWEDRARAKSIPMETWNDVAALVDPEGVMAIVRGGHLAAHP
jgi:hypothetical protein